MSNNDRNNSLTALIAGVVIGAAVTYLFTTKEGRKLKDRLLEEGSVILDKIKEGFEDVEDQIQEKGKKVAKSVEEKAEEFKEGVEDIAGDVPKHIQQVQKKGRRFFFSKKQSQGES